jgi:hypothetical protein
MVVPLELAPEHRGRLAHRRDREIGQALRKVGLGHAAER